MKPNFQLIIIVVFIAAAILGVLVFSGAIPIGEKEKAGPAESGTRRPRPVLSLSGGPSALRFHSIAYSNDRSRHPAKVGGLGAKMVSPLWP